MSKRLKFFLLHFLVSFAIAFFITLCIFFIWYPAPLAKAAGVTHIFFMLLVIDVILGPVLGFIVYKEGKKTLKMDLAIIIIVQIVALMYGLYNITQARPVWLVQTGDRFELVRNNDINFDRNIKSDYKAPSWLTPQFVATVSGKTVEEQNKYLFEELETGISASYRPERYTALKNEKDRLIKGAQELSILNKFNKEEEVNNILIQYPQANAWLPLSAVDTDMVVLINKENAEVIKIVDLRPWN